MAKVGPKEKQATLSRLYNDMVAKNLKKARMEEVAEQEEAMMEQQRVSCGLCVRSGMRSGGCPERMERGLGRVRVSVRFFCCVFSAVLM